MKKFKIFASALALIATMGFSSCSDDKAPESPLVTAGATTYTTLEFSWNAVAGATNYTYRLYSPEGYRVAEGETTATSMTFDNLIPASTYRVAVIAWNGDEESAQARVQSTTNTPPVLPAPVLAFEAENAGAKVSWAAVPGAGSYGYTYYDRTDAANTTVSGVVTGTSFSIPNMTVNNKYAVTVYAIAPNPTPSVAYYDSAESADIITLLPTGNLAVGALTVLDLVGNFNFKTTFYYYLGDETYKQSGTAELKLKDGTDNVLIVPGECFVGGTTDPFTLEMTVDVKKLTVTVTPNSFKFGGYTFWVVGPAGVQTDPAIGTIDPDTLEISFAKADPKDDDEDDPWYGWNGNGYCYFWNTNTVLTKVAD